MTPGGLPPAGSPPRGHRFGRATCKPSTPLLARHRYWRRAPGADGAAPAVVAWLARLR